MNTVNSPTHPDPITIAFLRNLCALGVAICVVFGIFLAWAGSSTQAFGIAGIGAGAFLLLRHVAPHGWRSTPFLILALAWLLVGLLDDGFASSSAAWVFHIPIALVGWTLFPRSRLRWVVVGMPIAIVLISNLSGGTQLLHTDLPRLHSGLHVAAHFMGAFITSILCVQHLMTMESNARAKLEEARAKAERASRAKDEFLSHMSHEFRTPLNAIHGFTEILLQETTTSSNEAISHRDERIEHLDAIASAAEHLTHIVNDILDLSRLESGEIRLQNKAFSPTLILQNIREALLPQTQAKHLHLVLDMPERLPHIFGDPVRWKQILINLTGNAIKFSQHGTIHIVASWHPTSTNSGIIEVEVQDDGPGIPGDMREHIFDRFVRAETVERAGTNGTGLGLAISRSLAQAMSGQLILKKSSTSGSVFHLSIPFSQASMDNPGSSGFLRTSPLSLKGYRVLLCEDNRMNIRLATKLLDRLEADYDVAEDGGKALHTLRHESYDLILLDLHMPVVDGFEVAAFLRSPECPKSNMDVPILALTADAFEETRHKARAAGVDDFLAKPYSFADLASRSMRLLELKARSR